MTNKATMILVCLALLSLASVAQGYRRNRGSIRVYELGDRTAESGGLYPIDENGKLGFIDSTGKVVVKPVYDDAGEFCEGRAYVAQDGKFGFIDSTGRVVVAPEYDSVGAFSEGLALVVRNGRAGYVNPAGKVVIAPQFERALDFSESLAPVRVRGKWGYIDRAGRFVVGAKYAGAQCFERGMGIVAAGDRGTGIINVTGKMILEPRESNIFVIGPCAVVETWDSSYQFHWRLFDPAESRFSEYSLDRPPLYSEGTFLIHNRSGFRFVDSCGKAAIGAIFDGAHDFTRGRAEVGVGCREDDKRWNKFTGGKWGYIDRSGKVVVEPTYDDAYDYDSGKAEVILHGRISFIDTIGKTVASVDSAITWVSWFHEGLAAAAVGATRDSTGRIKGGKMGFIDRTGRLVIPARYDVVGRFSSGRAAVELNGKDGYIDTTGKTVVEPTLKDAGDFIGNLARVKTEQGPAYVDRTGKIVWQAGQDK